MRGAPQRGFAAAIFLIRATISALTGGRPASGPAGELSPVVAEAATLPSQDGVGRHDDERLPPAHPRSGQAGPEQTIHRVESRPG